MRCLLIFVLVFLACGDTGPLPVDTARLDSDAGVWLDAINQGDHIRPDQKSVIDGVDVTDMAVVDHQVPDLVPKPDTKPSPDLGPTPPSLYASAGTMDFKRLDVGWSRTNVPLINGTCTINKTKWLIVKCGVMNGWPPAWKLQVSLSFQFYLPATAKSGQSFTINSGKENFARAWNSPFSYANGFFYVDAAHTAKITIVQVGSAKYSTFKATGQAILYGPTAGSKLQVTFNLDTTLD